MRIDHVLYGVRDLADATAWLERDHGLRAVSGGAHPSWGTANAVVPVGHDQYVELIAVEDAESAHPAARFLTALVAEGDRPVAVCLRPDDLDATARRLGLQIADGERANPDGSHVRWRMAGLEVSLGSDRLPFFIEWPGRLGNPELDAVASVEDTWIHSVELGGEPERLQRWMDGEHAAIVAAGGPPGVHRVALRLHGELVQLGER